MINPINGNLTISSKLIITPKMSKGKFLSLQLELSSLIKHNEVDILHVQNCKIDNFYFNFYFHFNSEKLIHVTFTFQSEVYSINQGWESWNESDEKANLERYKKWINDIFGDETSKKWGEIQAIYTSKTGISQIELLYK